MTHEDVARTTRRHLLGLTAVLALSACSGASGNGESGTATGSTSRPSTEPSSASPSASSSSAGGSDAASPSASGSRTSQAGGDGRAVEVVHGPRTTAAVALTFHGQGDPALTDRVLSEAEKAGAKVTVLAVGTWLQQYPAVAARILRGGHELGNHTLHHRPMRRLSAAAAYDEIVGGRDVVRRFTREPMWFRPSGTPHANATILEAAGRAGYRTSLSFDVDPADYADPGASAVRDRVLADVGRGSIVSLHLGHVGTAQALPAILAGLRSRGLAAVTVSQLLAGVTP